MVEHCVRRLFHVFLSDIIDTFAVLASIVAAGDNVDESCQLNPVK